MVLADNQEVLADSQVVLADGPLHTTVQQGYPGNLPAGYAVPTGIYHPVLPSANTIPVSMVL